MGSTIDDAIAHFLSGAPHAVVGASRDRKKYGNKALRCYMQASRPVFPINPRAKEVEGLHCYASLASAPEPIHGITIVTPPSTSEVVVEEAIALGIKHLWFQPGAESPLALSRASEAGCNLIAKGPCILVVLGYRER